MPNFLSDIFAPTWAHWTRQSDLVKKAMEDYGQLYAAYRQQVEAEARSASDRNIENLAREGKLTGATLAQAHALTNTWRASELSKAQLQAGTQQAAGRQQQREYGALAKQGLGQDVFNLAKTTAGAALTAGGMGAFAGKAKPIQLADATTIPGRRPGSQYAPWMTAVGENLLGVQGQPFTQTAMRQRYPQLYQQPQFPANFGGYESVFDFLRQLPPEVWQGYLQTQKTGR